MKKPSGRTSQLLAATADPREPLPTHFLVFQPTSQIVVVSLSLSSDSGLAAQTNRVSTQPLILEQLHGGPRDPTHMYGILWPGRSVFIINVTITIFLHFRSFLLHIGRHHIHK